MQSNGGLEQSDVQRVGQLTPGLQSKLEEAGYPSESPSSIESTSEEQGVIRRESRGGGPKRKESLDVVDVDGVFVCLGPPTCLCIECVEVTVKLTLPCS